MLATLFSLAFWSQFVWQTGQNFVWFCLVIALISVAEHQWPAGPLPGWRDRVQSLAIAAAVSVVGALLNIVMQRFPDALRFYGLMGAVFGGWVPKSLAELCLATAIYLLCYDFLQYWYHRALHEIPALWFAHALHHDDEVLNAATAVRHTMWHAILGFFVIQIPLTIICGPNLLTYYAAMFFFSTYGFFNHANIRLRMGLLGLLISGPQWHRLHHARDARFHDTNYAALFPFLDMLFGTYRAPASGEFPATGVEDRPMRAFGAKNVIRDVAGI